MNKAPLLMSLLLVTACAGQSSMTPSERLELYRANAGDPVSSFQFTGRRNAYHHSARNDSIFQAPVQSQIWKRKL